MKIAVYYQSGRIDVFDTSNFTTQEPFKAEGKNLASEFQLRLDLLEEEGLLLEVFWYNAKLSSDEVSSVNDELGVKIPHAVRTAGRRLRLVSRKELSNIAKITCDGELLIWRQGNELINGIKFFGQEILCFSNASTTSINARALQIFEYLQKANPGLTDENVAQLIGYSKAALDAIMADELANQINKFAAEDDIFD